MWPKALGAGGVEDLPDGMGKDLPERYRAEYKNAQSGDTSNAAADGGDQMLGQVSGQGGDASGEAEGAAGGKRASEPVDPVEEALAGMGNGKLDMAMNGKAPEAAGMNLPRGQRKAEGVVDPIESGDSKVM